MQKDKDHRGLGFTGAGARKPDTEKGFLHRKSGRGMEIMGKGKTGKRREEEKGTRVKKRKKTRKSQRQAMVCADAYGKLIRGVVCSTRSFPIQKCKRASALVQYYVDFSHLYVKGCEGGKKRREKMESSGVVVTLKGKRETRPLPSLPPPWQYRGRSAEMLRNLFSKRSKKSQTGNSNPMDI